MRTAYFDELIIKRLSCEQCRKKDTCKKEKKQVCVDFNDGGKTKLRKRNTRYI